MVRMAYLGVITAHTVNGVAAIHSDILREDLFREFAELWPDKFTNVTNGVTQRRWLAFCNEPLRELISERLGSEEWIRCVIVCPATAAAWGTRLHVAPTWCCVWVAVWVAFWPCRFCASTLIARGAPVGGPMRV